jgi:hypothetical protein
VPGSLPVRRIRFSLPGQVQEYITINVTFLTVTVSLRFLKKISLHFLCLLKGSGTRSGKTAERIASEIRRHQQIHTVRISNKSARGLQRDVVYLC